MRRFSLLALSCIVGAGTTFGFIVDNEFLILRRGDANNDGVVNTTDAIFINNFLYMGGPEPPCMNQADADDNGQVTPSDSYLILNWLFSGGQAPPAPGPFNAICAEDPPPSPGCKVDPCS